MQYVRCKNPSCGQPFTAPFPAAEDLPAGWLIRGNKVACPHCSALDVYDPEDVVKTGPPDGTLH